MKNFLLPGGFERTTFNQTPVSMRLNNRDQYQFKQRFSIFPLIRTKITIKTLININFSFKKQETNE